jgi:hypothetical protein
MKTIRDLEATAYLPSFYHHPHQYIQELSEMTTEQGPPPEMEIQHQLDQLEEKKNTEFHYKIKGRKKKLKLCYNLNH